MTRLVYNAFKAVMFAIIFVFIWDMGFFLFKALNLHQRMLLLTGQMVDTVEANNYMPSDFWKGTGSDSNPNGTYATLMKDIVSVMNSGGDRFIVGYSTNYSTNNSGYGGPSGIDDISTAPAVRNDGKSYFHPTMSTPAYYGDVMLVWMEVGIAPPNWGYVYTNNQVSLEKSAPNRVIRLSYRYVVPCLHYVKQA